MKWLHWIGLKYYTVTSFIEEAKRLGVSRRLPPRVLKSVSWGDPIYLLGEVPEMPKRGIFFGYFYVNRVRYVTQDKELNRKMKEFLADKSKLVKCTPAARERRGCGYEERGGFYLSTTAKVEEIADILTKGRSEASIESMTLNVLKHPRLTTIKSFRGYRTISDRELKKLYSFPKLEIRKLKRGVDIPMIVERYVKLRKKQDKKGLKRLRKALKSAGVWKEVKELVGEELSEAA